MRQRKGERIGQMESKLKNSSHVRNVNGRSFSSNKWNRSFSVCLGGRDEIPMDCQDPFFGREPCLGALCPDARHEGGWAAGAAGCRQSPGESVPSPVDEGTWTWTWSMGRLACPVGQKAGKALWWWGVDSNSGLPYLPTELEMGPECACYLIGGLIVCFN